MANLKNITELPVAESVDGLNLIVNDNGAAKQISANKVGKVKTVNGIEPDGNGNINIEIPEGFSGSWNDLKDKPFWVDEKKTLVVEGMSDDGLYLVESQLEEGKEYVYCIDGIDYTGKAYLEAGETYVYLEDSQGNTVCSVYDYGNIILSREYFDFSVPHKIELVEKRVIHKLDAKYLPDVGSKSYYLSKSTTSYNVNEEVYNALLAFYNDPTIGFPNITIKDASDCLCKAISIRHVPDEDGYANLKGFRIGYCYFYGDLKGQQIVIAPTQNDANDIENRDMA